MASPVETLLRDQLTERRLRLEDAADLVPGDEQVRRLLREVDAALDRMDKGTFGICESCHDTIEADRLVADPLMEYCLDHLTQPQRQALERDLDLAAPVLRALPSHFATLVLGRAARTGDVEISNAGHVPPLIVRGRQIERVGPTGIPIGMFCDARFTVTRLRLSPGDTILLYTDGVNEALNGSGPEYG